MRPRSAIAAAILAAYGVLPPPAPKPEPRKPSGKDRSKVKAARDANKKRRQSQGPQS